MVLFSGVGSTSCINRDIDPWVFLINYFYCYIYLFLTYNYTNIVEITNVVSLPYGMVDERRGVSMIEISQFTPSENDTYMGYQLNETY